MPFALASSTVEYRSISMPVSDRFRSKIRTPGAAPARTVAVIV